MKIKNKITTKEAEKFCAFLNECDNREMFYLIADLDREEIPIEVGIHLGGLHIGYPKLDPSSVVCSVILNQYSQGHEDGLLEIRGLLTDREIASNFCQNGVSEPNDVISNLTGREVYLRIRDHYNKHMMETCRTCLYQDSDAEDYPCSKCCYGDAYEKED